MAETTFLNFPAFVVLVFSVYGLARTLAYEDGPGDVLLFVRRKLGTYTYDENGRPVSKLGKFAGCPFCQSVWLALGASQLITPKELVSLIWWWAIVGGVYLLLLKE